MELMLASNECSTREKNKHATHLKHHTLDANECDKITAFLRSNTTSAAAEAAATKTTKFEKKETTTKFTKSLNIQFNEIKERQQGI